LNLSQLQHDVLGLLSFACHLVVLLKTGYSYPKRWTTSVGALQISGGGGIGWRFCPARTETSASGGQI
ncbi:hypothetical protein, partial [Tritonibacter scottomollicae]|uniref:hypothetical protein n=1 Tax=Tritonibacter scottomollicae TaxID=483013 RepID=UPI003BAA2DF0